MGTGRDTGDLRENTVAVATGAQQKCSTGTDSQTQQAGSMDINREGGVDGCSSGGFDNLDWGCMAEATAPATATETAAEGGDDSEGEGVTAPRTTGALANATAAIVPPKAESTATTAVQQGPRQQRRW